MPYTYWLLLDEFSAKYMPIKVIHTNFNFNLQTEWHFTFYENKVQENFWLTRKFHKYEWYLTNLKTPSCRISYYTEQIKVK